MDASQPYHAVLGWLAKQTNKLDEVIAQAEGRQKSKVKRNFGEITSDKDF